MTETHAASMVERVARAMYEKQGFVKGWDHPKLNSAWRPHYRNQARAAIEAMRKPTEVMVRHGTWTVETCTKDDPCGRAAEHIWTDMIDAATHTGEG